MLADSPVVAVRREAVRRQARGARRHLRLGPYGFVVPKAETDFAQAIADALKALDASDGSYKEILAKWGNEAGAITDFAVNP